MGIETTAAQLLSQHPCASLHPLRARASDLWDAWPAWDQWIDGGDVIPGRDSFVRWATAPEAWIAD